MSSHSTVDISLQGREYRVTCAPEERESLLAAVAHVETKMNEIAARTKGSGERLAVMTALNLAHELLNKNPAETAPAGRLNQPSVSPVMKPLRRFLMWYSSCRASTSSARMNSFAWAQSALNLSSSASCPNTRPYGPKMRP